MLSARKKIRIISLGEIVTPEVMETINAFANVIKKKTPSANLAEIRKVIGQVLHKHTEVIDDFKHGNLSETEFTEQMIVALMNATGVKLSDHEFDDAWNAMNPKFEKFSPLLKQAVEYNKQPNQQIIFISGTNPKDIRHLINELSSNQLPYEIMDGQLVKIAGILLYTTYAAQQTKAKLIESTIKHLHTEVRSSSALAKSMQKVLGDDSGQESALLDIKYIRGINSIKDPILKEVLDETNEKVKKKTESFFVETILWMKLEQQSLADVLLDQKLGSRMLAACKL